MEARKQRMSQLSFAAAIWSAQCPSSAFIMLTWLETRSMNSSMALIGGPQ